MNTGALWPTPEEAEVRVLRMQAKLHQWAAVDGGRRFDDLYNLVCDPAFLVVAWERVRGNRGARSAGVDGVAPRSIVFGTEVLLGELRDDLKARRFMPLPVRERMIPKTGGKLRRLGIPTARDRVVQASLKLVLEPIFEADFKPCSYGFRPKRRAQDAIAEIHQFTSRSYEWVLEGDITACFDEIDHTALMGRVRDRIADRRILGLVKAFLRAGVLGQDGLNRETITGTPQGGILSPLLANIALSVLDEHFIEAWEVTMGNDTVRARRRRQGLPNYRLVRYADDFVVLVAGTAADAERLRSEVAAVLATVGLRLSESKTKIVHIDEGFDFLGFRIQRKLNKATGKRIVYTYPSRKALLSITAKVRSLTWRSKFRSLVDLLHELNPVLRGWCNYFRHGVSYRTFAYLDEFSWRRVWWWLRKRHPRVSTKQLRRRFCQGWTPAEDGTKLFSPQTVSVTRYRWRSTHIPTPWTGITTSTATTT